MSYHQKGSPAMMICLAYISFGFLGLQFIIVLANLLFREVPTIRQEGHNSRVSVLIPARNEEKNLTFLLQDLLQASDRVHEIIVLDDHSTDQTPDVVHSYAQRDSRIRLISGEKVKKGWLGKNFACHQLAREARGNHLLFLDADVRISPEVIDATVSYGAYHKTALLSVFPVQVMETTGEKITVPLMNYILLTLLPLILVRKSPFASHAAANGQFMLFDTPTYRTLLPHEYGKDKAVEDIAIARYYKKQKKKISCLVSIKGLHCRMYKGYREGVHGFAKNMITFFGDSVILSLLFWLFTTLGFVPVIVLGTLPVIVFLLLMLVTRILVSIISQQHIPDNILYLPLQQASLLVIILKSIHLRKQKNYTWKGRNIYSS